MDPPIGIGVQGGVSGGQPVSTGSVEVRGGARRCPWGLWALCCKGELERVQGGEIVKEARSVRTWRLCACSCACFRRKGMSKLKRIWPPWVSVLYNALSVSMDTSVLFTLPGGMNARSGRSSCSGSLDRRARALQPCCPPRVLPTPRLPLPPPPAVPFQTWLVQGGHTA